MACLTNQGCKKYNQGHCMKLCNQPEGAFIKASVNQRMAQLKTRQQSKELHVKTV